MLFLKAETIIHLPSLPPSLPSFPPFLPAYHSMNCRTTSGVMT